MFRVLVVDDNEEFVEIFPVFFSEYADFEFVGVANVEVALKKLREDVFHAVITDIKMPHISGVRFFGLARQAGSKIPFFALSGHIDNQMAAELKTLGMAGVFLKPPMPEKIIAELRNVLK